MYFRLLISLLLCTLFFEGICQFADTESINLLKKQPKNEDHVVVGLSSVVEHSFHLNKKNNKVEASVKENTSVVALKNETKIEIEKYSDNETSIDYFKVFTGKKLKFHVYSPNECYSNFSEEIFSSDLIGCLYTIKLSKIGEIKRFETQETYRDVKYLIGSYITESYPIQKRIIKYRIPKWLDLDFHEMNLEQLDFTKKESFDEKTQEKIITYTFKNVRAYIDEENSKGYTCLEPHIALVFNSYTNEEGKRTNIMNSIGDMYAWYQNLVGNLDNKSDSLTSLVDRLITNNQNDLDKTKSIFYWVQDNIKYIAFEDGIMGFQPDAAYSVYKKRYGDCKGMANLAKNMLVLAGIDARLTWVGTSHISKQYNYTFPSLANDNHMICTVIIDSVYYFLDPTEDFIALGDYAARIQGRKALIEDGNNYLIKEIPSFNSEHNKRESKTYLTIKEGNLVGSSTLSYKGEAKTGLLWSYDILRTDIRKEKITAFLSGNDKNIQIHEYTNSDFTNREEALTFDYKFMVDNHVVKTDNELYVSINLNQNFDYIEIEKNRKSDFNLYYKPFHMDEINLTIPEGYKVEYLPAPVLVKNEEYEIDYSYYQEGRGIVLRKNIKFKLGYISLKNLEHWKTDFRKMKAFYSEQIVLKKQ